MRKCSTAVLVLVPVVALFAGAGFVQPEGEALGRPRGGQPADPSVFVDRIMERDADADGKVSREEMGEGPGVRLFEAADENTDGFLERAEIEKFFSERREAFNRPGPGGEQGAPAFHESMERAGRALRRLRRSEFTPESRAGDLEGIQAVQQALMSAKASYLTAEVSEKAETEFGGDDAKLHDALRLHLAHALQGALAVEVALLEGNSDAAAEAMEKLKELRDQGHDRFAPEDDENG